MHVSRTGCTWNEERGGWDTRVHAAGVRTDGPHKREDGFLRLRDGFARTHHGVVSKEGSLGAFTVKQSAALRSLSFSGLPVKGLSAKDSRSRARGMFALSAVPISFPRKMSNRILRLVGAHG